MNVIIHDIKYKTNVHIPVIILKYSSFKIVGKTFIWLIINCLAMVFEMVIFLEVNWAAFLTVNRESVLIISNLGVFNVARHAFSGGKD
jgi:hypothetical protein